MVYFAQNGSARDVRHLPRYGGERARGHHAPEVLLVVAVPPGNVRWEVGLVSAFNQPTDKLQGHCLVNPAQSRR